jgi:hypothetical protein
LVPSDWPCVRNTSTEEWADERPVNVAIETVVMKARRSRSDMARIPSSSFFKLMSIPDRNLAP